MVQGALQLLRKHRAFVSAADNLVNGFALAQSVWFSQRIIRTERELQNIPL